MTPSPSGSGSGGRGPSAPAVTPSGFVSRYQVLEKIGEGGMGSLYLARDPAIDRLVAIKVLRRGYDTPELRERFTREARAAGRLRHPNIVTIFDVGEHAGDPFIAMEFLAGETMAELVAHGARLSLARRLKLIEELCDGLAYAHRAGIVHRDIKPANLMVDAEGVLKILDFGIVRLDESVVTQSGVLVGTVNYMSPEQVMGAGVDHRSDIFAVGLVAYELLTGRQAFPGTLKDGLFNRILTVAFEPITAKLPELDPAVAAVVERALQREPAERYQDLARMRNDLARVRQRLEAAEEADLEQVGVDSGETVISMTPAPTPAAGVPAGSSPVVEAAERALASGDFRAALTLAGRSAATAPNDPSAGRIMAQAQAGLLERGRSLESGETRLTPPPVIPGSAASAHPPAGRRVAPVWIAVAAVVALAALAGGMALMRNGGAPAAAPGDATVAQPVAPVPAPAPTESDLKPAAPAAAEAAAPDGGGRSSEERTDPRPSSARDTSPTAASGSAARNPTAPPAAAAPPPARPVPSTAAVAPATILRVGRDTGPPRRIHYVPPQYPASAEGGRARGSVQIDLTVGRDGHVAEAQVTGPLAPEFDRAALAAVRQWEFTPLTRDGVAVPFVYPVTVDFVPPDVVTPASPAPPPPAPAAAKAAPVPATPPPSRDATPPAAPAKGAPDIRAESAAIQELLRRYAQAWESRDADAVARLHQLSPGQLADVRSTLDEAQAYGMRINVHDISVEPTGRRATVRASIERTFNPRSRGRSQTVTTASELILEKRGDAWMVTGLR